jgi:type IV pilus assembly protein PilX
VSQRKSPPHRTPAPRANQRGVVLFIALIVMVAMSLAAIALIRSVDTTTTVIGNLAFRQASILPANFAVEDAAAGIFADASPSGAARIPDLRVDNSGQNYCATHPCAGDGADDKYGVPPRLQTSTAAGALTRKQQDGATNTITYVIERMCNVALQPPAPDPGSDGSPSRAWCEMAPPKQPPGTTINDPSAGLDLSQVFYRVTVRVDGPPGTNTVSFAQAMLR